MRTMLTRRAGQPGTKKLLQKWGEDLVCVRYRYDEEHHERLKTVRSSWTRAPWRARRAVASALVRVRIAKSEDLLRRAVLFAGGKWDERTDTWLVTRATALALGIANRAMRQARNLHADRKARDYR